MENVLIIAVVGGLLLLLLMVKAAFGNTVRKEVLAFQEYPGDVKELSIFFISDIHRRLVHTDIIDEVKGKADIVIIGGDLTEKGVPFSRVRENLEKLFGVGPMFFVWGNNDYEVDGTKLNALFREYNVTSLKNEAAFLSLTDNKIVLIGTDYMETPELPMRAIVHSLNTPAFRILVSHDPSISEKLNNGDQISLILSGHTHGGQIRLFGFGPYEKGGIKKLPWATLFVSNGYGTSLLPLRFGAPAETHLITVCKKDLS